MPRPRARRLALAAAVLAALLAVARLALDPLAAWQTRRLLAGMEGMRGAFEAVHVAVKDLSCEVRRLHIERVGAQGDGIPYLDLERARLRLRFRDLLRGRLVASAEVVHPKLNLVEAGPPPRKPAPSRSLESLPPFRIERAEVKDGEIRWVDARDPDRPELWLHGIAATLEGFATRPALTRGQPTAAALSGTLGRSGELSIYVTADLLGAPAPRGLSFAGQATLLHLALRELGSLLAAKADLAPQSGTLDVFVRFRAEGGRLSGGIRPIVRGVDVDAAKPGPGPKLKEWLADASLRLFRDDVPGREAVATTIPIEGNIGDPQAQAVPTILGVLRNSFVRGVESGLRGVPPPKAPKRESLLEQARRALSPRRGEPRAQPPGSRP